MKEQDLINMGFKKKTHHTDYWYELRVKGRGKHTFITNDTSYNKRKNEWMVGYALPNGDDFWFNNNLNEVGLFRIVFNIIVGMELKLAHQRKLIK